MKHDEQILRELYRSGDEGVCANFLATKIGTSCAALWKRIEELRRIGFEILTNRINTNQIDAGHSDHYRLLSSPDLLFGEDLMARIHSPKIHSPKILGRQIQVFRETASTNEIAQRLGKDGVAEGVIIFSEHQTRGRGRLGRHWTSARGKGILMSVLLRPQLRPSQAARLTIIAATAVSRAMKCIANVSPSIKWPNDVMFKGRKLAGILTEMHAESGQIRYLVLGIGINVNQKNEDIPEHLRSTAASLKMICAHSIHRATLATAIIEALDADYQKLLCGDFPKLIHEWETRCETLGKIISVHFGNRHIEGCAETIDADGALLVRTASGQRIRVSASEVSIRSNKRQS